MNHAQAILLGMIRGNLEQAFELLQAGKYALAKEHLTEASLQVDQLAMEAQREAEAPQPKQIPLIV
jgi:exonuclease VII small subunit